MYLENAWYVAAWEAELGDKPVARTLLGKSLVLFRDSAGKANALEDSCPHRRLPLSMGCIVGDTIRCGYHGMQFERDGRCVSIPGQSVIPPQANVQCFPVIEQYGLVWVWMGDAARASADAMIDIGNYGHPGWAVNRGPAMDVACHYQLMTDNLLDPTHVSYVHASSLGGPDTAGIPVETHVEERRVIVSRWIRDHDLAPFFAHRVAFDGKADRLQHYELRLPSSAVIKDVIAPAGSGAPEGRLHPATWLLDSYNFVTPVDDDHCRYYWFQLRNYAIDDRAEDEALTRDFIAAFEEDLVVLAAVHQGLRKRRSSVDLASDRGSYQARRMLTQRLKVEQATIERP